MYAIHMCIYIYIYIYIYIIQINNSLLKNEACKLEVKNGWQRF